MLNSNELSTYTDIPSGTASLLSQVYTWNLKNSGGNSAYSKHILTPPATLT